MANHVSDEMGILFQSENGLLLTEIAVENHRRTGH